MHIFFAFLSQCKEIILKHLNPNRRILLIGILQNFQLETHRLQINAAGRFTGKIILHYQSIVSL